MNECAMNLNGSQIAKSVALINSDSFEMFTLFQGQKDIPISAKRYSDKVDRLYFALFDEYSVDSFYNPCLSSDNLLDYCKLSISAIDRDSNGRIVYIRTRLRRSFRIMLRTWTEELPIEVHGQGFRSYAFSSGTLCNS